MSIHAERNVNNPTLKHCTSHTFAVYLVLIPHHQNYEILASKVAKLRTTAKNAGQILGIGLFVSIGCAFALSMLFAWW